MMKDIIEKMLKALYNIKNKNKKSNIQNNTGSNAWVICPNCKYRGSLEEFLKEDKWDTRCPKCGEDVSIFEL